MAERKRFARIRQMLDDIEQNDGIDMTDRFKFASSATP